jgi:microcystin-dependent protein
MAEPFLSEIRIMSFGFAPQGWALCNGQLLPINQNQALFSLVGTTYGGDGRVNFGLPNLQGKVPIHFGPGFTLGQTAGEQNHTLIIGEVPTHTHVASGVSSDGGEVLPTGNSLGVSENHPVYGGPSSLLQLDRSAIANTGGSQAHPNMQPFLTLSFCIALQGIFPSQS